MNIKENMTQVRWEARKDKIFKDISYIVDEWGDNIAEDILHKDAQAIVTAVNNTYGKGINPEAVGELVEALKKINKSLNQTKVTSWYYVLIKNVATARQALEKAGL